ncbi:hypothetical protein [Diaminobutyricibacter sp. McL0608]
MSHRLKVLLDEGLLQRDGRALRAREPRTASQAVRHHPKPRLAYLPVRG